jgi:hypothetical protein
MPAGTSGTGTVGETGPQEIHLSWRLIAARYGSAPEAIVSALPRADHHDMARVGVNGAVVVAPGLWSPILVIGRQPGAPDDCGLHSRPPAAAAQQRTSPPTHRPQRPRAAGTSAAPPARHRDEPPADTTVRPSVDQSLLMSVPGPTSRCALVRSLEGKASQRAGRYLLSRFQLTPLPWLFLLPWP